MSSVRFCLTAQDRAGNGKEEFEYVLFFFLALESANCLFTLFASVTVLVY